VGKETEEKQGWGKQHTLGLQGAITYWPKNKGVGWFTHRRQRVGCTMQKDFVYSFHIYNKTEYFKIPS